MIQLVGPGGAGKSTIGAALAARLGCPFEDLDRAFERRHGDIGVFLAAHGYPAYAHANVAVYLDLAPRCPDAVLALSSGFMVYPPAVHPAHAALAAAIARSPGTVVLLPALDRETCVAETVRRQLGRPFGHRGAAREEAVIRARFDRYLALPAPKVATMGPVPDVVTAVLAALASRAAATRDAALDSRPDPEPDPGPDPELAASLAPYLARWEAVPDGAPRRTATSVLLPVRHTAGPAMLKLAHAAEERRGAALPAWWDGDGAARVLAHVDDALLLERAEGTRSLAATACAGAAGDEAATRVLSVGIDGV